MKKKSKPLVSIVTPSYNQGIFIEETIKSVKNQNYENIEHLIYDGGSTDETIKILKKYEKYEYYNLKWVSEKDKGQADAINKGFSRAEGKIIGWLNSDDMYYDKNTIKTVVKVFNKNENIDVLYGDGILVDENSNILKVQSKPNYNYKHLLRDCYFMQPAVFFNKRVIKENKLDIDLNYGMDYEYWLRLGKKYNLKHVNKILASDRNHKKRKILAFKKDVKKESIKIREKYGQKYGVKYYINRLIDKIKSVFLRLKGLIYLISIYFFDKSVFVNKNRSFKEIIIAQLFKNYSNLL